MTSSEPGGVERYREEITEYFERRRARLRSVATTRAPSGVTLDWIPLESQDGGRVAAPPDHAPIDAADDALGAQWHDDAASGELEVEGAERGPAGTVPIVRKDLSALTYSEPLRDYLAKGPFPPEDDRRQPLAPGPGRGRHWWASVRQHGAFFGASAHLSCFNPHTAGVEEFSLLQIALLNDEGAQTQSVEAGWQRYRNLYGDWSPRLFVYYTTNGHTWDDDNLGGYNRDVDGWVQVDERIFPGSGFVPHSVIDGAQRKIRLRYTLHRGNWWLGCQNRWIGYYPGRLFTGEQSVFESLADHASRVGYWGEVATFADAPTSTDMGSGRFSVERWMRSAYIHHMRVQANRSIDSMTDAGTNASVSATDSGLYTVEAHLQSGTAWRSYAWLGGPGAV